MDLLPFLLLLLLTPIMTVAVPAPAPAPAPAASASSSSSSADGKSITAALGAIQNKTTDLGTSVSSWSGHLLSALPITISSSSLLGQIKDATSTAHASDPLTLDGALAVALATGSLAAVVQTTLRTIVDNKPRFDKLLILSPVVLIELKLQRHATAQLSGAIVDKVPEAFRAVAQGLIKPIDDAFGAAIDAFTMF
ncbi:hypothetical protein E4U54_006154 [Claviceps lovelessii]|nr:hypothetical protein E4U54_006154 [Claviceps lovelessii]